MESYNQNLTLNQFFLTLIKDDFNNHHDYFMKFMDKAKNIPQCERLAFEIPTNGDEKIDFHLNIKSDFYKYKLLQWLTIQEKIDIKWQYLRVFIAKWIKNNEYAAISGIFLEFDYSKREDFNLPSFFVKVNKELSLKTDIFSEIFDSLFPKEKSSKFIDTIKKIESLIPNYSSINYIGFMLSRPEQMIRININGLYQSDFIPFLKSLAWEGKYAELDYWANFTTSNSDKVILSFDLMENKVLDKIGLEVFIEKQPDIDYRWQIIKQKLIELNLWHTQFDFLNHWNKKWTPQNIDFHQDLIVDNLINYPNDFPLLKQLVSHIKITITNQKTDAKLYLGVGQTHEFNPTKNKLSNPKFDLNLAIQNGLNYICKNQNQDGFWRDYNLPAGYGSEWITAFVITLLYQVDKNFDHNILYQKAEEKLNKRWRENKGLGYNKSVPSDSDSTTWFLKFKFLKNKEINKTVLNQYKNQDLGLGTYPQNATEILNYIQLNIPEQNLGWTKSHDCVTANAAYFDSDCLQYICNILDNNKSLKSYWWSSDLYTIWLAYEALVINNEITNIRINNLTSQFISIPKPNSNNSFDLSIYLLLKHKLLKTDVSDDIKELLRNQNLNGSFTPSANLLVPMPKDEMKNSSTNQWDQLDINAIYTTTTVIYCLNEINKKNI